MYKLWAKAVSRSWIFAGVLLMAGFAIYSVTLENGFLLDDESQVQHNMVVHSPANFKFFFLGSTMNQQSSTAMGGLYYKPIMSFCYSVLWWLSPDNPTPYHVFQLLLAIANAWLAFLFLRRHLIPTVAGLMSLLFLVHPINTEIVTYIADLQDVLYTFFGLLALNYVAGVESLARYTALVKFSMLIFLALLSKESGVLYAVLCPVYVAIFRRDLLWRVLGAVLFALGLYLVLRVGVANLTTLTYPQNQIGRADLGVRLLTAPLVLGSYLWKFVFPRDITATQDWVIAHPTLENFWLPLIADFAILALAVYYACRQWASSRRFAFFTFWVFMGMGFHSHIVVSLDGTVADRWFYFSSLGLLAMLGVLLEDFAFPKLANVATAIILLWGVGLGIRSSIRGLDWSDNFTLCAHDLQIFPDSYDMHNNLGVEHFRRGRIAEAKVEFERSVQLAPGWDVNWNNLGSVYFRTGDLQKAEQAYMKSMQNGTYYMAFENYAHLLVRLKRYDEAKTFLFQQALPRFPESGPLLEMVRIVKGN